MVITDLGVAEWVVVTERIRTAMVHRLTDHWHVACDRDPSWTWSGYWGDWHGLQKPVLCRKCWR